MNNRDTYIVGNWKMNLLQEDIHHFFQQVKNSDLPLTNHHFWVAPQFIHIPAALQLAGPNVEIGAQDCSSDAPGAFTGDVSAEAIKDMGASFVIIGHSERRSIHKEDHDLLNRKVHNALKNNLKVIFCVGETLEQRENGQIFEVVQEQLCEGLKNLEKHSQVIIAYEPVWAIGTGKTATAQQAEEVHAMIRDYCAGNLGFLAQELIILYGGSVKPENIAELLNCENIDGGLVGGASLKADSYLKLRKAL